MSDTLYDQIQKIFTYIGKREYEIKGLIDDEIRELGGLVMSVHETLEGHMDNLIIQHIIGEGNRKTPSNETAEQNVKITTILQYMEFWQKIKICQKTKLFGDIKDAVGAFEKVNSLRIKFSHPQAYRSELKKYTANDESYLEVVKVLERALKKFPSI